MRQRVISLLLCVMMTTSAFGALVRYVQVPDSNDLVASDVITSYGKDGYEYANEESKLKVYFDESSTGDGVKVSVGDHWVVWKWKEMGFRNGNGDIQTISAVRDVEGTIENNMMAYESTYPFTTDVFTVFENKLKHEIILTRSQITPSNFQNIDYLSCLGTLEISDGLSMYVGGVQQNGDFITSSAIGFRDAIGIEQFFIPSPCAFERYNENQMIDCYYEIKHVNGEILFYLSTLFEWLDDPLRIYPVIIDPTFCVLYEPVADAGPDQIAYVDDPVYFDGSESHDVDGYIVSYDWDFGDGSPPGSGVTPSHVYTSRGIYTVTLTVTDNDGLTGTDTTTMYISNSIQDLIDAASPGDTVNVPADLYWERIIIDKPLTLIGEDRNTTVIDGWGLYGDEGTTVTIEASNVDIQGFTIKNGTYGIVAYSGYSQVYNDITIMDNIIEKNKYAGIVLGGPNNYIISNNIIRLNRRDQWSSGQGIVMYDEWNLPPHNNQIIDNLIEFNGDHGISISSSSQNLAHDNVITGNIIRNHRHNGIRFTEASYNLIENNNISDNNEYGIELRGSNNTINNNYIWNNSNGIRLGRYGSVTNDNTVSNNTITNNYYGLLIYADDRLVSNNIIRFNTFSYNQYGVFLAHSREHSNEMVTRNKIYLNNFLDNTDQGEDEGYDNRWDTGNIGNYWSDYLGVDCGGMSYPWDTNGKHLIANDGIGDTLVPHMVDEDDGDYYPIIRLSGWVPTADAGPDQTVDVGDIVIFSGIGSWDLDGWIVNYTWDFGNGSYGYGMNVTHTYPAEGIYTVTLTVTDNDGFTGTDYCNITVIPSNEPPVADINGPYSGNEGAPITFDGSGSYDPDGDILQYRWDLDNDGIWDTSWTTNPYADYTWGDDYSGIVAVEVYDGEFTDIDTSNVTVCNVAPSPNIIGPNEIDENSPLNLEGYGTDPGSDDLTFTWEFEFGPTITNTYYNDGMVPDSHPSPEINPMNISEHASHIYGDNGVFAVSLTVEDDDGGIAVTTFNVTVNNVLPVVDPGGHYTTDENSPITLTVVTYDTGSDDLTITWDWGDGFSETITTTYFNDNMGPDPYPSPEVNPISFTESRAHIYGDNGVFNVTLTVADDDNGTTIVTVEVIVNNIAPTIVDIEAYMHVNFSLRVAGEKYHSVGIRLYEDDVEIWNAQVTRQPGSPDAQAATLTGYSINLGSTYRAIVDYHPNDPRVNGNVWGANPVWIILEFRDGTTERLHHTFNVRQSYWDSDHWNHIDPWEVDLTSIIYRHNITFEATASDPGSDDLTFVWDFGDGGTAGPNTYFNNGIGPDPFPSPEINPMSTSDTVLHAYIAPGIYTITLTVMDDDGGTATTAIIIVLPG